MRIPSVLLVAAAACCLAGCSAGAGGSTGPAEPASAPPSTSASSASSAPPSAGTSAAVDLAGTTWRVQEVPGTTVHFDGTAVTVSKGGASSSYAWAAQGDQILVGAGTSSLDGPVAAGWLTSATSVDRSADDWTLRDAQGATTATLTSTGPTAAPTTATTLLESAVPGEGVVDVPASALEGTWTAPNDAKSAITFSGGRWRAASSCTSGAVGGLGVYRVLPGGRLIAARTATPIRGCPVGQDRPVIRATAISGIARAGSFRISGDTLTLFDRTGALLGSLVRA